MGHRHVVEEMVASELGESRQRVRQWRGTEPARVLNVEQVQIAGGGHQVMVVLETPEGPRAFTLEPGDADAAAQRIREIAAAAQRSLFVPTG